MNITKEQLEKNYILKLGKDDENEGCNICCFDISFS
jgi:hypothetical protein